MSHRTISTEYILSSISLADDVKKEKLLEVANARIKVASIILTRDSFIAKKYKINFYRV